MFSQTDIDWFRKETKGTNQVIHLNNAGSALPPDCVREGVLQFVEEEMTQGGYEIHEKYFTELEGTYDSIARLINAESEEVALQENATVAWGAAFQAIEFQDGDEILTCQWDYSSNYLSYLHLKRKKAIVVKIIPNDASGQVDVDSIEALITDKTKLISIVHVPTNGGIVNPVAAIGTVAKKHGILYQVDACQSAGQVPIDVKAIGCDILSATGRKYLRGPRGTGFLFVRKAILGQLIPTSVDLHAANWTATNTYVIREDARRFENWESNYSGIYGLKKAVDYILDIGMESIWQRIQELGAYLRGKLQAMDKVTVYDLGKVKGGIVTFSIVGHSAAAVKEYLKQHNINISWVATPNARLDMESRNIPEMCRSSVHYYNTEKEVDQFIEVLGKL